MFVCLSRQGEVLFVFLGKRKWCLFVFLGKRKWYLFAQVSFHFEERSLAFLRVIGKVCVTPN